MNGETRFVSGLLAVVSIVACGFVDGEFLAQASSVGHAPHGTVTIDGVTVPDIGPLPAYVPAPPTNLSYSQKVELGKQLYFDGRLSQNNIVSCAFCHNPGTGFADARQAPTVFNTGFIPLQFWDGRAGSLEEQAIGPIHNPIEMAEKHETVVPKIVKIKGYQITDFITSVCLRWVP